LHHSPAKINVFFSLFFTSRQMTMTRHIVIFSFDEKTHKRKMTKYIICIVRHEKRIEKYEREREQEFVFFSSKNY